MDIPKGLLDQIIEGNAILFLGSGASLGAASDIGGKPPMGQELSDKLADKFLSTDYKGYPLQSVAELSINEQDLFTIQRFIYDEFSHFKAGPAHKLIPTFKWKAIFTTNYDLIIEHAYSEVETKLQELVRFRKNGESINEKLLTPNSLMYVKLHGCISNITDASTPLILSPDQYITHRKNRNWLFDRLISYAYNYPILFIGQSLSDHDLRSIINYLDVNCDSRIRSYMVGPNITPEESRFWETKKITTHKSSFKEFITDLDKKIKIDHRKLSTLIPDFDIPIFKRFIVDPREKKPTQELLTFLDNDVDYLHTLFTDTITNPSDFYKGYFTNWDPIISNYDVQRDIGEEILSEILFGDPSRIDQELYAIKGYAGSGKSVLLKRIAWDSAVEFEKLCLYVNPNSILKFEPISELYSYCKERIYLFIDNASDNSSDIVYLLQKSQEDKIPLTIITTERVNIWNIECDKLLDHLNQHYEISYLSHGEIEGLIELLEKHKSLNHLKKFSHEERIAAFSETAGKQLLVALYEATHGKPFEDIIVDEYHSIDVENAKSLYLTVSLLHRLGAETRAGLISRVHGISFTEFKSKLFKPLEFIIFNKMNYRINDFVFLTRHQYIAQIIFEEILVDPQNKFDEFIRLISCLDVDYDSDWFAFLSMTKAKNLLDIFKDPTLIRKIYAAAKNRVGDDPKLLQQEAIFEMSSSGGKFEKADLLLSKAHKDNPEDLTISHSFAEMSLKKAEKAKSPLEKSKYINDAKKICNSLISKNKNNSHNYHTLLKSYLAELQLVQKADDASALERLIKNIDKTISIANQLFPKDPFILESESNYNKILNNIPDAIHLLNKSFQVNKSSPFIALRLAGMYELEGEMEKAKKVISQALQEKPGDKDLNFKYANFLLKENKASLLDIKHYLRRSFTKGDTRYQAQFQYGRCLFLLDEKGPATEIFESLKNSKINPKIKSEPRSLVKDGGKLVEYAGSIITKEASFGFLERDINADSIFLYRYNNHKEEWVDLRKGSRVKFNIGFNYKGPIALNIKLI